IDLEAPEEASIDERVDMRLDAFAAAVEAAVLGDPGFGERAPALDRPQGESAAEVRRGRRGRVEVPLRDNALGQVVDALKSLPARDRELAGGEQMLERAFFRLPPPHRPALALERAHGQSALVAYAGEHATLDLAPLGGPLASPPVVVFQLDHPPLEERVVVDREQTCLVCPVLEDASLAKQPRDLGFVVGADARGQRQSMGA